MAGVDAEALKRRVAEEVDRRADVLIDASHEIHAHPELCFEERFAHDLLTSIIDAEGLPIDRSARGLDTAFESRVGDEGPTVAVLCEYDALPGIGHACGHNIIGAAGLGAGLAAAALAGDVGGRIVIMGTPAEEGGGGKVLMAEQGAFDDVDAAMMVHPAQADLVAMNVIANHRLLVDYHGQAAHAAASPERGVNALDAAVLGYVNIAALRQHIRADERVHGIFTHAGENPNIVPRHAQATWYVRSPRLRTLQALTERVIAGLEAGAAASGCTMDYAWKAPAYFDMLDNGPLANLYVANAAHTGRTVSGADHAPLVVGSTDMGNVSYVVPAIHPMIKVAPPTVSLHSPEFTRYAASAEGDRAVIDAAKAMAMTVLDLWLRPDVLASMRKAHRDAVDSADADPALLDHSM